MRKLIGSYNGENIYVFNIHIEGTHDGSPCGGMLAKKRIIETTIPEHCKRYFGNDRPVRMIGIKELDLKESLSEDVVYAHIGTCCPFCGNYLNLVWFQEADVDPFAEAQKHLKEIDWEKESWEGGF